MCPSLIQIGSKTAEKNSAQTNRQRDRQTNRHYENNGHLADKLEQQEIVSKSQSMKADLVETVKD